MSRRREPPNQPDDLGETVAAGATGRRSVTPDYPYHCPAPYCGLGFHTMSRRDEHFELVHTSPVREPLPEAVRERVRRGTERARDLDAGDPAS